MARFPNTLGCMIADHLINDTHTEITAPVITAVVRDLKRYMGLRNRAAGQRILPVGLGGGEYEDNLKVVKYLTAGDEGGSIDFWTVCMNHSRAVADVRTLLTDHPQCTGYNRQHNRDSFSDLVRTTSQTSPPPHPPNEEPLTPTPTGRTIPQHPHPRLPLRIRRQHQPPTHLPRNHSPALTSSHNRPLRRLRL
jgi:hypothetical protein